MKNVEITRVVAKQVLSIVDQGLSCGLGNPEPGQMCVEAAVCYALGLPHGDNPPCVASAVRRLKITLNDSGWSSNAARARGMRRLALIQLGTLGINQTEFALKVAKFAVEQIVPRAFNPAEYDEYAESAVSNATIAAKYAKYAKYAATTASAVSNATIAVESAALTAKYAAKYAKYAESADKELEFFAEGVVQILVEMKATGAEWLDLTE